MGAPLLLRCPPTNTLTTAAGAGRSARLRPRIARCAGRRRRRQPPGRHPAKLPAPRHRPAAGLRRVRARPAFGRRRGRRGGRGWVARPRPRRELVRERGGSAVWRGCWRGRAAAGPPPAAPAAVLGAARAHGAPTKGGRAAQGPPGALRGEWGCCGGCRRAAGGRPCAGRGAPGCGARGCAGGCGAAAGGGGARGRRACSGAAAAGGGRRLLLRGGRCAAPRLPGSACAWL